MIPGLAIAVASAGTLLAALSASTPSATEEAFEADALTSAFSDICLRGDFAAEHAERAFGRLGWNGEVIQHPTMAAPFTTWSFPFGEVSIGYRTLGGINLRIHDCSFTLHAEAAPPQGELADALEDRLAPVAFRAQDRIENAFTYTAHLIDKDDEQAIVLYSGDEVPFSRPGAIDLQPGILVSYSYARGPHAKDAIEY